MKRILIALALAVTLAATAAAQIAVPNTLVSGTTIRASDLNTNFSTLGSHALDRLSGGNIQGNITVDNGITIDGVDIGATVCPTCAPTFGSLSVTGNVGVGASVFSINASTGAVVSTGPFTGSLFNSTNGYQVNGNTVIDAGASPGRFFGNGANITALSGSNISTGTVAPARLGSGSPSAANFLRGDGTWTAVAPNVTSQAGTYTAAVGDFVLANGTFTVNLPAVSGTSGAVIDVKNIGSGVITVDANASETIDGALTFTLDTQFQSVTVVSNGTSWFVR